MRSDNPIECRTFDGLFCIGHLFRDVHPGCTSYHWREVHARADGGWKTCEHRAILETCRSLRGEPYRVMLVREESVSSLGLIEEFKKSAIYDLIVEDRTDELSEVSASRRVNRR